MTHILIVGATGINGSAALRHYENKENWRVTTLSRGPIERRQKSEHIAVDLLDGTAVKHAISEYDDITHIFYAALKPDDNAAVEAEENGAMFENLLLVCTDVCKSLDRVVFLQGGKVYGAHLGVYKTPAREDDSRHFPPNLYFDQEDIAKRFAETKGLKWTALRPDIIIGPSKGSAMNLGNLIGTYGALCKAQNVAMQFPGSDAAYNVLVNLMDSDLLAEAVDWAITDSRDGAYNVTNGDQIRWKHVWPKLAEFFELATGEPQPVSMSARYDAMQPVWADLAKTHGLVETELDSIAKADFGDFIFNVESDAVFDVGKARRAGFVKMNRDTAQSLLDHLQHMRDEKLIP